LIDRDRRHVRISSVLRQIICGARQSVNTDRFHQAKERARIILAEAAFLTAFTTSCDLYQSGDRMAP
jgi:hypothetical protein